MTSSSFDGETCASTPSCCCCCCSLLQLTQICLHLVRTSLQGTATSMEGRYYSVRNRCLHYQTFSPGPRVSNFSYYCCYGHWNQEIELTDVSCYRPLLKMCTWSQLLIECVVYYKLIAINGMAWHFGRTLHTASFCVLFVFVTSTGLPCLGSHLGVTLSCKERGGGGGLGCLIL